MSNRLSDLDQPIPSHSGNNDTAVSVCIQQTLSTVGTKSGKAGGTGATSGADASSMK